MDDKKIYKIMQKWFPEFQDQKIPPKKERFSFENFYVWGQLASGEQQPLYLMRIDLLDYLDNGIQQSAVFQRKRVNTALVQTVIAEKVKPLQEHYEKYKQIIGHYYNLNDQIYDVVFEEILKSAKSIGYEMLLIYADSYYWIAVPDDEVRIEKLIKHFEKQFKSEDISIEHYAVLDCSGTI